MPSGSEPLAGAGIAMARTEAIVVRVEKPTKVAIEKLAGADGRSVSQYIERLLIAHINGKPPQRGTKP